MGIAEPKRPVFLRFGCPIQFTDRWQGTLAGAEVADDWEVLNIVIERGFWRWKTSVKLAFSTSPHWSNDSLILDCTSRQAFAREIPPVAVRGRQLSADSALSVPGARLGGLLVEPDRRRATDVIVKRGRKHRFSVAGLAFDGNTVRLGSRGEELALYLSDDELLEAVQDALAQTSYVSGNERSALTVVASAGAVTVRGNVRTKQARELVQRLLAPFATVAELRLEVVDDIDLELAIGRALERSAPQQRAEIYPRSILGDVTLFGRASSVVAVDDVKRIVAQEPGVLSVTSRMMLNAAVTP